MIATILKSSRSFAAVSYNENKRKIGDAILLEIANFGYLGDWQSFDKKAYKQYLIDYSSKNKNIKNTQFHAVISCKGDEYSKDELLSIAHEYMKQMGYENNPTLIYAHTDTENNHLHIITSRVNAAGNKISDSNERIKSQRIINKIMGIDMKNNASKVFEDARQYLFNSINQFRSIIESQGYECYLIDNKVHLKKGGDILMISDIPSMAKTESDVQKKRKLQLKAIFNKYENIFNNSREQKDFYKKKFGIDIIIHGKENKPYGYTVVDHAKKMVFKGSEIKPLKSFLSYVTREEQERNINDFMVMMLDRNKRIGTKEMSRLVANKFGVRMSRGELLLNDELIQIDKVLLNTMQYNDRLFYAEKFQPKDMNEKEILSRIYKIASSDIKLGEQKELSVKGYADDINRAFSSEKSFVSLNAMGIKMYEIDGTYFFVDKNNSRIFSNDDIGLQASIINESMNQKGGASLLGGIFTSIFGGQAQASGGDGRLKKKKKRK